MDSGHESITKENQTTRYVENSHQWDPRKLVHTREDRIHEIVKNLHDIIKEKLEVCKYCATAKIKQKLLRKVAEEQDFNPVEIIYIDIISQKKTIYGGPKNHICIQD